MNINNYYNKLVVVFFATYFAMALTSCSNDYSPAGDLVEDEWLHPYNASASDQVLQNNFYNKNGIYLLFNDTLKKERVGTSPDGEPFYKSEVVDLAYILTGNNGGSQQSFSFEYVSDENKQSAVSFFQDVVLPHLGGALRPFSVLLVNKINYYVSDQSTYFEFILTNPAVYSNDRCTAIDVSNVIGKTEEEKQAYCSELLKTIINSKIAALPASTFDKFYSYTLPYYSTYAMYDEATAFFEKYPTSYDIGLLDGGYYAYGSPYGFPMYNIKAKDYDLTDYTNALFDYSETEFEAKYGNYPIVMAKYRILKQIFEDLGVIF